MWTQALALAERFGLRRERASALYEIGRAAAANDPAVTPSLSRAAEIFEGMGAAPDLAAARLALSS